MAKSVLLFLLVLVIHMTEWGFNILLFCWSLTHSQVRLQGCVMCAPLFKLCAQGQLCSESNTPSSSLSLSTALKAATRIRPECARRLWAVTLWSKSHPYLAEPVVKKQEDKKSRAAKNSKRQCRAAVTKVIQAQGNALLTSRDHRPNGLNSGSPFNRKKLIIHI